MSAKQAASEPIKAKADELGFAFCGVARAEVTDYGNELKAWLKEKKHGEMTWLENHVGVRCDPGELLEGARSVICVADYVRASEEGYSEGHNGARGVDEGYVAGRVARYAQVDDYHKIIKKRLFRLGDWLQKMYPQEQFRACVDTAPILEREHAMRAGLGWVGKHTLTINRELGSHLLLGELVTTLTIEADEAETDHCGSCTRCVDACPTDCITPYSVDATRCISYLTIEHRSTIDEEFFDPIGDWLYGCDICQDVCPFNERAERLGRYDNESGDTYGRRPGVMDALAVLGWTEKDRRAAFTRSAMKRAKLGQMKRNALIVAGNHLRKRPSAEILDQIERIATSSSEDTIVRQTARDVLDYVANWRCQPKNTQIRSTPE